MRSGLAAIALAPLLLAQGRYVRCVTPRLPEPTGSRRGTMGEGEPLRLLIAGDSSAAGVGAETQQSALSGQVAASLARHFQVSWRLVARTGRDVQDVLESLAATPAEAFDVALVAVGVNDVTGGTSLARWRTRLTQLCECLQSRFSVRRVLLTPVPPMHAFPALPQPLRWYLGKRAASMNETMQAVTAQSRDWECIEPDFPLIDAFMASDGFHPGPEAYSVWAGTMARTIREKCQGHAQQGDTVEHSG